MANFVILKRRTKKNRMPTSLSPERSCSEYPFEARCVYSAEIERSLSSNARDLLSKLDRHTKALEKRFADEVVVGELTKSGGIYILTIA